VSAPVYDDALIRGLLADCKVIAMVGASPNWNRPSYFAMKYMQDKGYRVIPVNPVAAGQTILGELCYADLAGIPPADATRIQMVDIFRNSAAAGAITMEALAARDAGVLPALRCVWMQFGVVNHEAAAAAAAAGVAAVMDRCPKVEYSRLFGELGWHGFNSGVVSSKRRKSPAEAAKMAERQGGVAPQPKGFETLAIHAGAAPDAVSGSRATPIHQTTAFVFDDVDHAASLFNLQTFGNVYGRLSNPTTAVLEERLAALEGGVGATATASGHAAQLLILFTLCEPGSVLVASDKLYGGSITQFGKTIEKFGWRCIFVDTDDAAAVRAALAEAGPSCKGLWAESLANPGGSVSDLAMLSAAARAAPDGPVPFIVDNTMATPFLCRPKEHGADLVCHSTTKFISGHGTAMGGCVVDSGTFDWTRASCRDKFPSLCQPEPAYHGLVFAETFGELAFTIYGHAVGLRDLGPTMAPMNAFLTLQGLETLPLRMERHCANAQKVAAHIDAEMGDAVSWVSYAGLPGSKYHSLAEKYTPGGAGAVFTMGLRGGFEAGVRAVERVNLFSHVANIGDTRSLILHPASTTHRQLTEAQRAACGAGDEVLRLSVGLESADDLIADLEWALAAS
jgi:O-acetylhomoserine (thiol)-lyase